MKQVMIAVSMLAPTLCACVETPAPPPLPAGPCRVDLPQRMRWVGQEFRMKTRDEIRYDAHARTARVLRHDDAATMDYREDRLNIRLSEDGKIDALDCG